MADAFIKQFSSIKAVKRQNPISVRTLVKPSGEDKLKAQVEVPEGFDATKFKQVVVRKRAKKAQVEKEVEKAVAKDEAIVEEAEKSIEESIDKQVDEVKSLTGDNKVLPDEEDPSLKVKVETEPGEKVEVVVKEEESEKPVAKKKTRRIKFVDIGDREYTRKAKLRVPKAKVVKLPGELVQIGDTALEERLGKRGANVILKQPAYYKNNREIFVNFINSVFQPYRELLDDASRQADCSEKGQSKFELLAHQLIVRDYLNLYTPYRGLLLYHGLGSGKTCSSIAIAEGLKENKHVIVMTPASLRTNYKEELKKCGDPLYKKLQHWEFIDATPANIKTLSYVLKLPVSYIKKGPRSGAWLMNSQLKPNYDELPPASKKALDNQIDEMLSYKYKFISYNGLRKNHIDELTTDSEGRAVNPFDDKVVVIDEAHNLVSMIVNKLGKPGEVASRLYELLMSARRARIVMLSGTPVINYPNELGIMFNMLRGYIRTWRFTVSTEGRQVNESFIKTAVLKQTTKLGRVADYVRYTPSTALLEVTRNPFGFVNRIKQGSIDGVKLGAWGQESDEDFVKQLTKSLASNRIRIKTYTVENFKALPDNADDFKELFLTPDNQVQNMNLFKRRIIGLASYFPDMYTLMPKYDDSRLHIEKIPMSDFQFSAYEEIRAIERKQELKNAAKRIAAAKKGIFEDTTSTYRTFSRAFCNFVFPAPDIVRPFKQREQKQIAETAEEDMEIADEGDEYNERIREVMEKLEDAKEQYLSETALATYSPKFLAILRQVTSAEEGLHLVYSQFRTVEGIGVFRLVLLANGFAEFKVRRDPDGWQLDMTEEDLQKPTFALYTGTESDDEKEIVRRVYNGEWDLVPSTLRKTLLQRAENNSEGEIIKVFMITASGAEGISLKNTRFVHIMEPHWHPVRIEQVIGRARRICSHSSLRPELRTVDVYIYLMEFSEKQLRDDATIELRLKDIGKVDPSQPLTTDEALFEISKLKEQITKKLLTAVQEASIDCALHKDKDSPIKCVSFGAVSPDKFSFKGDIAGEEHDDIYSQNIRVEELKAKAVTVKGVKYAFNPIDSNLFDWRSYEQGEPRQVGKLIKTESGYIVELL